MNGVKARCKNCGGEALADQFKLHHGFKTMVCPACYTGKAKTIKEVAVAKVQVTNVPEASKIAEQAKPPGWDKEDEYLERATRMRKQQTQAQFSPIEGTDFVHYVCGHCKYKFRYNPTKRIPPTCPYCDFDIPKVRPSDLW